MTIRLLRFPFLVQKQIFEEMGLLEALSIAMLSKKSQATVRACLRHHKYHLRYVDDQNIRVERKLPNGNGHILVLLLNDRTPPPVSFQLWRFGNHEVAIKSKSKESNGVIATFTNVVSDNISNFATEILQYLSSLRPKLSLTLGISNAEKIRRIMKSVESVEEIKKISVLRPSWNSNKSPHDELVKLVLDECQRAKNLSVSIPTSDNFVYPITTMPFNFDSIFMSTARWVSREHFIKMFLSCKKVQLQWKNFTDEDLTAIFKSWTEGSRLEYLELEGTFDFYRGKKLGGVFRGIPGAAPVRNAIVPGWSIPNSEVVSFGGGKCYRVQQRDGQTTALVCINYKSVILTTDFKIGKEVDDMVARIEEEERLRREEHFARIAERQYMGRHRLEPFFL
ncbi:hypothetical protein CAEBREN_06920 [Caenorhabditis brenneri]|uniref:Sdz-33 F-box domain-containing protein n=1 Tax=Caenorhabditis brenneri TaxID=135651 RepID=G0NCR6_CAEBE|nr:hypothetical protein CAEBREN_06920 [Caenorhabditis brenneri]